MKPARLALLIFAVVIAGFSIAGTKVSRMTRATTFNSNTLFYMATQDASGRWYSRQIEGHDLARGLGPWITNATGGGGAATNAIENSGGQGTNTTIRGLSLPALTANRAAAISASGDLTNSTSVDLTELSYVDGVTSAIQTQLDAKTTALNAASNSLVSSINGKQHGTQILTNLSGTSAITNLNDNQFSDESTIATLKSGVALTNQAARGITNVGQFTQRGSMQLGDADGSGTTISSNTFQFYQNASFEESAVFPDLTGNRVTYITGGKALAVHANATPSMLDNLTNVTSDIQTQLGLAVTNYNSLGVSNANSKPIIRGKVNQMFDVFTLVGGNNVTIDQTTTGLVLNAASGGLTDGDKGDVTVSGSATVISIDNDVVTDAQLRESAGFSVIGKATTGTGNPADITAGTDTVLGRSGSGNLGFAQLASGQIAADAVTYAKIQNVTSGRILGRSSAGSGDTEEIQPTTGLILAGGVLRLDGTNLLTWGSTNTGNLSNSANAYIGGSLVSHGGYTNTGAFSNSGAAYIGSTLIASSDLNVAGDGNFAGPVAVSGGLNVTLGTVLSSTLNVSGATTLSDTLGVTGAVTANTNATIGGTNDQLWSLVRYGTLRRYVPLGDNTNVTIYWGRTNDYVAWPSNTFTVNFGDSPNASFNHSIELMVYVPAGAAGYFPTNALNGGSVVMVSGPATNRWRFNKFGTNIFVDSLQVITTGTGNTNVLNVSPVIHAADLRAPVTTNAMHLNPTNVGPTVVNNTTHIANTNTTIGNTTNFVIDFTHRVQILNVAAGVNLVHATNLVGGPQFKTTKLVLLNFSGSAQTISTNGTSRWKWLGTTNNPPTTIAAGKVMQIEFDNYGGTDQTNVIAGAAGGG